MGRRWARAAVFGGAAALLTIGILVLPLGLALAALSCCRELGCAELGGDVTIEA